ncbi:MAG TPA: PQQ-binding-like beta-propeller repeat protein [Planctomycetaceae bacterium]|nr:PQQ-binding-like beta-propeller repeat protein [Planctomycetaceae bacterium]
MKRFILMLCVVGWINCPAILQPHASAADWPQFRGPGGQGHSDAKNLPLTWSETENITWKVPIAGLGWSSPSIQGNQIWLTTALDGGKSLRAIALDRKTGETLHDVEIFTLENPGDVHSKNSHASPTPLIEGDRVYVHFGAHGTACLTTDGKIVWSTQELKHDHRHGPGGSPVIFEDLLILNCDGSDIQFVVALDKNTGKIRWQKKREHIGADRLEGKSNVPMAYTTPLLIDNNGTVQLLSCGADSIVAYNPRNGDEYWWFMYDGYSNVPRPVVGKGLVFISSGYDRPEFFAVRIDGSGDVTESHLAWNMKKAAPLNPSPLLIGDELYLVNDGGIATCLDAVSGEQHWQERLGGNFSASPTFADGRIYLLDEEGTTTVIAPGREFKVLATNKLDGRTLATPAFVDSTIFLRTDRHLYRIEKQ